MILKGFKKKSNKKYLNKLLSKRHVNVTSSKIESLGVVLNIDEFDDFESFRKLVDFIKIRANRLKIIAFSENKKDDLNSWDDCFNPKDFGWNGIVNNIELQSFLNKDFDVLISYYQQDVLELKLITASSKSKFKVGILQADERLNDLIIKTDIKEFKVFKNEIFRYLTILNKIKMKSKFLGTGVALVTPFNSDLSVDHKALANIVNFNIENGTEYLVICGTTGESVTLTKEEKQTVIKTISETNNGRLPLVLGIGGNSTTQVIEEIKATDLSGIDAILSVSPYYNKPTQEGLYQHFKEVSKASPVDIILYNVPGRTSKNMEPETTLRLANDFNNIIAVKEAGNNMAQYLELLKNKPEDFLVISGDDDLALGVALAGGAGVISVIGQAFPKDFSEMIRLRIKGRS